MSGRFGTVYLVGAGPGDPDLLTVRAARLLREAEVLAPDALVAPAILALAPPRAERIPVGYRCGTGCARAVIHPLVVERARAGRDVVRLKAGDPMVFGRGAEEAEGLRALGIPFEIVPGVSAAFGAAAAAGIPLTDRRCAAGVTLMTGHLMERGCGPATPAAMVAGATRPEQRIVVGHCRRSRRPHGRRGSRGGAARRADRRRGRGAARSPDVNRRRERTEIS